MSGGNNNNYGKKGACLTQFIVMFILFVVLLIWLYNSNPSSIN